MKVSLTDRFLRNLKPPEFGRLEVSDTKRKGPRIRVSAKGNYVWLYEKRVKGGPKRKHTLGNWPALSLADARDAALEIEAEARRGIDRVAIAKEKRLKEETAKATMSTFQQVVDIYDELHLSQLSTGTERRNQIGLRFQKAKQPNYRFGTQRHTVGRHLFPSFSRSLRPSNGGRSMIAITKNAREQIRIERQDYMGHDLINMRVWYDDGSGEYRPGKQGIAIRVELVGDVIDALGETVSLKAVA